MKTALAALLNWALTHLMTPTVESDVIEIVVGKIVTDKNVTEARAILTQAKTIVDDAYNALPPITVEA